jgi:hypothetical protein
MSSPWSDTPRVGLLTAWFYGAVAISALLTVATALWTLGSTSGVAASLLGRISLTGENNAAAWWSGMLLAMVSLHAYDGYALLRQREPGAARGWAMLAAVLLFLSADEVGSIHERLSHLGKVIGLGSWSLLLPIGAVLAAVLAYAMILLWSAGAEQRRKTWPITVGFLLLGSVALQEFLEHEIQWQTETAEAIRAAVEEGTELFGMLVLLRVAMANTAGLMVRGAAGRSAFAALWQLQRPLLIVGLALTPVLAFASAAFTDQQRGHPADWLAAVGFLAAALVAFGRAQEDSGGIAWRTWAAGGLCGLASVASVAIGPAKMVGFGPLDVNLRLLVLGTMSLLVCAIWQARSSGGKPTWLLGGAALALSAAVLPWSSTSLVVAYALAQLLALAMFWVHATPISDEAEGPVRAVRAGTGG